MRALEFAREASLRDTRIKKPAVAGAILDMGFCLDLLNSEHIASVKKSYGNLKDSCQSLSIPVPENRQAQMSQDFVLRYLDCAVLENLHYNRIERKAQPFDSVRSVFIEGAPLYTNAGFYAKSHIQLCIRNPNCIKGYFHPRKPDPAWPVP